MNRLYDITWFGSDYAKRFMKSVNGPKPGYASVSCSTVSNIPYNLILTKCFNDSSILITIISYNYLNLSLADEHVGDVTIPIQIIEYNQNFLHVDKPIRLKYSNQIKLYNNDLHETLIYTIREVSSYFSNPQDWGKNETLSQFDNCGH